MISRRLLLVFVLLPALSFAGKTDSLLGVAARLNARDTNLPKVYTQIAWAYLATNDSVNTVAYFKKSIALAGEQEYDNGLVNAWSNYGLYFTRYGKPDSAVAYFLLCLKKAKETDNATIASKACLNIAGCYLSKGDYASAIQYYLEAMPYLEKMNDQVKIAINYHCLGIAYYALKNYPLSLKYYFKSMETGRKIGTPDTSGYNDNGIGVVYKEMGKYDSARYYLGIAHIAAERHSDVYLMSHNLSNEGEVYVLLGQSDKALPYLKKALELQAAMTDKRGMAETSALLGDAYLVNKSYKEAAHYYDTAKVLGEAVSARDVLASAWKGLSGVYKGTENAAAALDAYQRYANLKDTLYTEESSRQIAEMQTKYNTEKKEKENVVLQKDNAEKNLQLVKEKNQKYILVGSFAFLVVLSVIFYNDRRLKQKNVILKERELRAHAVFQAQEDEKGRLSKELHDGVGALLSLIKLNLSSIETDEKNEKLLGRTKALASDVIKEVRTISHDLMPSVLEKSGLKAALEELIDTVKVMRGMDVTLSYNAPERLPRQVESNLFRIVQEAINNIIKHANASNVQVNISTNGKSIMVQVSDNGDGFDKNILSKITGNGLNNIYSRVNALRGSTEITTGKGTGTKIHIEVPLNDSNYA